MEHEHANGGAASFCGETYPGRFIRRAPQKHRCPRANRPNRVPNKNSVPTLQPAQLVEQPFVVCDHSHHHVKHITADGAALQSGAPADDLRFFGGTVNQKSSSVWHNSS